MSDTDTVPVREAHTVTVLVRVIVINLVLLTEDLDRVDSRHRQILARLGVSGF